MPKFEKLAQRAVCECYALWSGKKNNLVVRATVLKTLGRLETLIIKTPTKNGIFVKKKSRVSRF